MKQEPEKDMALESEPHLHAALERAIELAMGIDPSTLNSAQVVRLKRAASQLVDVLDDRRRLAQN